MSKKPVNNDKSKLVDLENKYRRALADYANLEKRFNKDSEKIIKFANTSLLIKVLEIKDNLERASLSLKNDGVNMIITQLNKLLSDEMVKEIEAKGKDFDPELMEAEEVIAGDKNKVIEITQAGYMIHDRVLRPAKVKVGNGLKNK